jgi:hypothetical protein
LDDRAGLPDTKRDLLGNAEEESRVETKLEELEAHVRGDHKFDGRAAKCDDHAAAE